MTINVTIYVEDIDSQGGCFTYWPGSHNVAYEYFKTHSLLSVQGGVSSDVFAEGTFPQGSEFVGKAGDAIFWHGQTLSHGFQERQSQYPHGPHRPLLAQRHQRYPL